MSGPSPPLRFLAAVVGGWAALRAAMLAPLWPAAIVEAPALPPPAARARLNPAAATAIAASVAAPLEARKRMPLHAIAASPAPASARAVSLSIVPLRERAIHAPPVLAAPVPRAGPAGASPSPIAVRPGRWSASAWALLRRGGTAGLASGGLLGGSQLGARLTYRLNRGAAHPLSLSARLSAPASGRGGAEAALGLEWQPLAGLPLRLLAERRQALDGEGRSAFALLAHGGVHDQAVAAGLRLDAHAQAGIVGARSRDLFADGAARLALPLGEAGRVRLGAGIWAAAQPGAARFDAGPHASLRLPGVTVGFDWRFRLAGDAAPGSGPAATLSTDF